MCIVCDINVLPDIFNSKENEFTPVKEWIFNKRGKFVYGGTSYLRELSRMGKFLKILKYLGDKNKTVVLDKDDVNFMEVKVKSKVDRNCNDPHLIAILAISGCKLVCSKDKKSYPYLQQTNLYPSNYSIPKIYSKK